MIEDQLSNLRRCIRKSVIGSKTLDRALRYGQFYGSVSWQNCDGFFHDNELEQILFTAFRSDLLPRQDNCRTDSNDWLHVISAAYDVGGHTKLLVRLVKIQRSQGMRVAVAITRHGTQRFKKLCEDLGCTIHYLKGSPAERVRELILIGRTSKMTMLHIHPDDLGAAIAARALRTEGRKVFFLNHADHVFSFGPGACNAVVEVSGFGWQTTEKRRAARAQHFLGIPIDYLPNDGEKLLVDKSPLLTVGASYKYEPFNGLDFPNFAIKLLDGCNRNLTIIGSDGSESWWSRLKTRHGERVNFFGSLPSAETQDHIAAAACYVDSFPVTGGTVFTEALVAGKTVFGPPNPVVGYSIADVLRSSSIAGMATEIFEFLATGIEPEQQAIVRRRVMEEFGEEAISTRLAKLESGYFETPPPELLLTRNDFDFHINIWRSKNIINTPRELFLLFPKCTASILMQKMYQKLFKRAVL